ncbi:MAG: carbohydrate kinase [Gammaproteobacteria bacterium]|nr:carbohydrate kinase [Gammaproteobacteria bacterium]
MGGAPFNVAWHLQGLGLSPFMVTSVGDDELGNVVLDAMQNWGMDTRGVQVNRNFPTGQVTVSLNNGQPAYTIKENQAYDHIDADQIIPHLEGGSNPLLYHGSLLTRTIASQKMLNQLIDYLTPATFVDINLRPPWWTMEHIMQSIFRAKWLKLNDEELATVMQFSDWHAQDLIRYARKLFDEYQLETLIVTLGDKGAFCVSSDGVTKGPPVRASVIDTVGAGDSFSAVMIAGTVYGWPLQETLNRALQFAAAICEIRGATSAAPLLYDTFLNQWRV